MRNFLSMLLALTMASIATAPLQAATEPAVFFASIARTFVGAFEALGQLDERYDETGACGPGCSVWNFSSQNPSIRPVLETFEPRRAAGAAGPLVGCYAGYVVFRDEAAKTRRCIVLRLLFSGEDITAHVTMPPCSFLEY